MEQQGEPGASGREFVSEALAILSIHEPYFLPALREDLGSALWNYGFALSPDEMKTAESYLTEHAQQSDQEIRDILGKVRRRW